MRKEDVDLWWGGKGGESREGMHVDGDYGVPALSLSMGSAGYDIEGCYSLALWHVEAWSCGTTEAQWRHCKEKGLQVGVYNSGEVFVMHFKRLSKANSWVLKIDFPLARLGYQCGAVSIAVSHGIVGCRYGSPVMRDFMHIPFDCLVLSGRRHISN